MKSLSDRVGFVPAIVGAVVCLAVTARAQSNGFFREVYTGLSAGNIATLTNTTSNPNYPNSPATEAIVVSALQPATNCADYYGQRLRALITAPSNGLYTFWICADDMAVLYLGTNSSPSSKAVIATVNSATGYRNWTSNISQHSSTNGIALTAGQQYYLEALHAEGGGSDYVSVRWQLPVAGTNVYEEPIPASRLTPYGMAGPQISQSPTNLAMVENGGAAFTVKVVRPVGMGYQWQRNGTNIAGATGPTLTLNPLQWSESNSVFRCLLTNVFGSATSGVATVTVLPDTTRPTVTAAQTFQVGDSSHVAVTFSEDVDLATATNAANYSIAGLSVLGATAVPGSARQVILRTAPWAAGSNYVVSVSGVRDIAAAPNTILPGSTAGFTGFAPVPLEIGRVRGTAEPPGSCSRRTGIAISEIMYHPAARSDGRCVEYVELYNSQPFFEDLSGCRLAGGIDYTFPSNTVLGATNYLVVAPVPADVQAVYGLTNVLGGLDSRIDNGSGTLRLENELGATLLEANYDSDPPWPAQADGGGHSLVLARPTYGEGDPRAWAASAFAGGSPGGPDPATNDAYATVLINEILAHTDPPDWDYIELFNYGTNTVDLGGCVLTDDPATNKFTIPAGVTIPPQGFVCYFETNMGFALNAAGETVYFRNPAGTRVLDALRFGAQENGMYGTAFGRYPDGAPSWGRVAGKTPGAPNAPGRLADVVINEIMYHPISEDPDDQYVELYNRTAAPVDLVKWRLEDGIGYTFPSNSVIPAHGYVVVGRSTARMTELYPALPAGSLFGGFSGTLSGSGERIALSMPDDLVSTNAAGKPTTNKIHIVVHEVTYGTGGRWGAWSDGGGSSLELKDPDGDPRLASNWADSDETAKSAWTNLAFTGVMDWGMAANMATQLHVFALGAGECLVDNVEVFSPSTSTTNWLANGTFEAGSAGWTFQGVNDASGIDTNGAYAGTGCLHIRSAGRGDTGANRIRANLAGTLTVSQTITLRAKFRWLKGWPEALLRIKGNWADAAGTILTTHSLGTPGARNSRAADNAGPAIFDVTHAPIVPATGETVTVSARIQDPDGVAFATLYSRTDPSDTYTAAVMTNRGAGCFSATLPVATATNLTAFYIQAVDLAGTPAVTRFPDDAPARECLVRMGDPRSNSVCGIYRLWVTLSNLTYWAAREKNSNKPMDATFVYNTNRVVYDIGTLYSGSPWHAQNYTGPLGGNCDYLASFPPDDKLLGDEEFVLATDGNLDSDRNGAREQACFWMLRHMGTTANHRRYMHVYLNGVHRASIYEDAQQPNSAEVKEWFPDDNDGDLYKIEDWFEFDNAGVSFSYSTARLAPYLTTGNAYRLARYRWNWRKRAVKGLANDYTNIYQLVSAVNESNSTYAARMDAALDQNEWMRVFAVEHFVGNFDSYGFQRGKNMFAYLPQRGPWHLMPWDIDFGLNNGGTTDTNAEMNPLLMTSTHVEDPQMLRFLQTPVFTRTWWRTVDRLCNRVVNDPRLADLWNAKYVALTSDMYRVTSANTFNVTPAAVLAWIGDRRLCTLNKMLGVSTNAFATTAPPDGASTNVSRLALSGTAPIGVKTIRVNGVEQFVTWTTVTNWTVNTVLGAGTNVLAVQGCDENDLPLAAAATTQTVYGAVVPDRAEDRLRINEIMYNPVATNAAYVELRNGSATTAFDLSNWRLDGVGYTFPEGAQIATNSCLVLAEDAGNFTVAYGTNAPVFDVYPGHLDTDGETLKLVQPGSNTPTNDVVIDEVTYGTSPPWPAKANGLGASLQLINSAVDNNRVANWAACDTVLQGAYEALPMTNAWRYYQAGPPPAGWADPTFDASSWASGAALLAYERATNIALPAATNTVLSLTNGAARIYTYYFRSPFVLTNAPVGAQLSLKQVVDDGVVCYLNGKELSRTGVTNYPASYSNLATRNISAAATIEGPLVFAAPPPLLQGTNWLAAEVHQYLVSTADTDVVFGAQLTVSNYAGYSRTPATGNVVDVTLSTLPPVWLNEVQPENATGAPDLAGHHSPWVELYNSGTGACSLADFALSDSYTNLARWAFPSNATIAAGGFLRVWLDGATNETAGGELHTSFAAGPIAGSVALSAPVDGRRVLVDYLNYDHMSADRSYGAYPDGAAAKRRRFYYATPGATNRVDEPGVQLCLNEWMAGNLQTLPNPARGGNYGDDWFEIYNAGTLTADLSGYTLTDDLSKPAQCPIPDGVTIGPGQYLLVWADGLSGMTQGQLHVSFSLKLGGESLGLYRGDGTPMDTVTFGPQTNDVSEGRWPNGNAGPTVFFTEPTPGAANLNPVPNSAPAFGTVPAQAVDEESLLSFAVPASDPDADQALTFGLLGGPPEGAEINAESGLFTWTPSEAQGPGVYTQTVVVTDNGEPALGATNRFAVTVREVNRPPLPVPVGSPRVNEEELLVMAATSVDPDLPAQAVRYRLGPGAPAGVAVDPDSGVLSWTPSEAQGPGDYPVAVIAEDPGTPPLAATNSFTVSVDEVNRAPVLPAVADTNIDEEAAFALSLAASDPDLPAQDLRYALGAGAPSGAVLDAVSGRFSWTPGEEQGPGAYPIVVIVSDSGTPPLGATNAFTIGVAEVNRAPWLLVVPGTQTVWLGRPCQVAAQAGDPDWPTNGLTFSLGPDAPTGAAIDAASGRFSWTPPAESGPTTNAFTLRVTDDGAPPLFAEQTLTLLAPAFFDLVGNGPDTNGQWAVRWNSRPGKWYRLEYKDRLEDEDWTGGDDLNATNETTESLLDPTNAPAQRFIRVRELP